MVTKNQKSRRERKYTSAKEVIREHEEGFKSAAWSPPEGVSIFKFSEEKTYRIDIIPFVVGEGNPHAEEGFDHYERSFYVHRNIGPNQQSYCCLAKTFGKDCPVCEHRQKIDTDPDGDADVAESLKPQQRKLWLVYDYDDPEKGIQIMDTAHYKSFGELLHNKIKAGDDDDGFENFFHLEDGMTLKVTVEEASFKGRKYFNPINIEMKPRKKQLPTSLTEDVPCLDELLVELPYKELKKKLLAAPKDEDEEEVEEEEEELEEEEEEEKPTKKPVKKPKKKTPVEEEEEEEEIEEEVEEEEVEEEEEPTIGKGDTVKGKTLKGKLFTGTVKKIINGLCHVESKAGNLHVCDPDELTLVKKAGEEEEELEEEEEEEKPAKKPVKKPGKPSKPTSKKPSKDTEEEEEEEEIEEEEEEEIEEEEEEEED